LALISCRLTFFCFLRTNDHSSSCSRRSEAIEDARAILGAYIAPGPHDPVDTVNAMLALLDRQSLVRAD